MRFTDAPERVLLMTAGHVVLPTTAKQNDPIFAVDMPSTLLGVLRTWTSFKDDPTADAAFIWVDPNLVAATITGLGAPTSFNTAAQPATVCVFFPQGVAGHRAKLKLIAWTMSRC